MGASTKLRLWATALAAACACGCAPDSDTAAADSAGAGANRPQRVRPGRVQLLGAAIPQTAPGTDSPAPPATSVPSAEDRERTAVLDRLRAILRIQRDRPTPLAELGLEWTELRGHRATALGHHWALYFGSGDGNGWVAGARPAAADGRWCCVVWPAVPGNRPRAWFANHEGTIWEAPAPSCTRLDDWLPDPDVIAPHARSRSSYLRRPAGAGFLWAELGP